MMKIITKIGLMRKRLAQTGGYGDQMIFEESLFS